MEGIPFYGSRGDAAGPDGSNRFTGSKRNNSDSFMMSSRDKFLQGPVDSQDSQLLTKVCAFYFLFVVCSLFCHTIFKNNQFTHCKFSFRVLMRDFAVLCWLSLIFMWFTVYSNIGSFVLYQLLRYSGGERPKRPHDEEASFGMHQMRPISASFVSQNSTGGRTDNNPSKWDRATAVNPGPALQYPPRTGQVIPFGFHAQSNRFKETNAGPSVMSQTAADEGSRTGIKGSGVLSSINGAGAISGRQPAGVLIRSGKQKFGAGIPEPDTSTTPRLILDSGSVLLYCA